MCRLCHKFALRRWSGDGGSATSDSRCPLGVSTGKQVAERATAKGIPPAAPTMLGRVVDHVAALAKRGEVSPTRTTEGRIVVEVGGCKIDGFARHANCLERHEPGLPPELASATVAPGPNLRVPPHAVDAELGDEEAMGAAASLAPTLCARETDDLADLGPVDRVEPAMFRADRHRRILSHPAQERKEKVGLPDAVGKFAREGARPADDVQSEDRHPNGPRPLAGSVAA